MMHLNLEFLEEFQNLSFEVNTVIRYECLGDSIPINDVLPDEVSHLNRRQSFVRSCFDPFSELIDCDQDESVTVRSCWRDLSDNIDAPGGEWPRRCH